MHANEWVEFPCRTCMILYKYNMTHTLSFQPFERKDINAQRAGDHLKLVFVNAREREKINGKTFDINYHINSCESDK